MFQLPEPFQVEPTDDWGVLGPTKCPFCRMLRKDPVFQCILAGMLGLAVWAMAKAE